MKLDDVSVCGRARFAFQSSWILALFAALLVLQPAAAQVLVPDQCVSDADGANDQPGQKDLTQWCVDLGDGSPYELHAKWNWDETSLTGGNTADGCALFDLNGNGLADIAVCVTWGTNGVQDPDSPTIYQCGDTRPDRCAQAALFPEPTGGFNTACFVEANSEDDPFDGTAVNGPGDDYPADTSVTCDIDLDDFGGSTARLLDTCSYPSQEPNSDPSDCVVSTVCTVATQNEDCTAGGACMTGACDPDFGICVYTPDAGATCDDGLFCNVDEVCNDLGFCDGGAPLDCSGTPGEDQCNVAACDEDSDACELDPVADSTPCTDGNVCTTGDVCVAGACSPTGVVDPDDGNLCTDDSCDPLTGVINDPIDPDDGNVCTDDSCDPATGVSNDPINPDDGNACTADSCDPVTGVINDPIDPDDGNVCTEDSCDPATGVSNDPVNPDDGVACTEDSCDPVDGVINTPLDSLCANGDVCDGDEVCDPVNDCQPGTPLNPDDGVVCTEDSCDPVDGVINTPLDSLCANGDVCDGNEVCDPLNDCQPGTPLDPDDGVVCTEDSCDPVDGVINTPLDSLCANGDVCDGDEVCDPLNDCQPGTPIDPDDGNACTVDSCDPAAGVINDPIDPDDGVVCTEDSCDPVDGVINTPLDSLCANGDVCDGNEVCDPLNDCQPGTPLDPDDGVVCTEDSCDPVDGVINTPLDSLCANGDVCDGDEVCDPLNDCQPGTPLDPDDGNECTEDSCDPIDGVINTPNVGAVCGDGTNTECNPADTCNADGLCEENIEPEGALCGGPGDGLCDAQDTCDGLGECVDNFEPPTTVCRDGAGECDLEELCDGAGSCPADEVAPDGTFCGDDGTECVIQDICVGGACEDQGFEPYETACGSDADTACTNPDFCDGDGVCLPNNESCSQVTDSALCTFDVSTKGVCVVSEDDPTPLGTVCDVEDPALACETGYCMNESQFRLLFTPNVQGWPSYKLNASNPGQTFYNAIAENEGCTAGDVETFTVRVPFPYVTVGGMPVHVYDGALVGGETVDGHIQEETCFVPPDETVAEYPIMISLEDWANGGVDNPDVACDTVVYPNSDETQAYCEFEVQAEYTASCQLYLNIHLDFGLKGPHVDFFSDAGGVVMPGGDGDPDRYDKGGATSPWDSADAWADNTKVVAIEDCQDLLFSHETDAEGGSGSDIVQNLNVFKRPAGVFGLVTGVEDATEILVELIHPEDGVVATATPDEDGYYLLNYKHKGRPTIYTVQVSVEDEMGNVTILSSEGAVRLKGNGFGEASYDADADLWTSE